MREPGVETPLVARIAESHRDDERQRLGMLPTAARATGPPGEREVERSALVRPAPVVEVRVLVGLVIEDLERFEVLRERVERPFSAEVVHRPLREHQVVFGRLVGDVLPEPFLTRAVETDHRGLAEEAARNLLLVALEVIALDGER